MFQRQADSITIDVAGVTNREELHALLAEAFAFPDYYGHNWDAFDECIRDVVLPPRIHIRGVDALHAQLPREADLLRQCVRAFVEERPDPNGTFLVS
jgi:RNAse (barnase) inhibitor barstar